MFEIGRVVLKIAGRDAGKVGVVIDNLDEKYVLIDGNVRRRKCNINHLEPLKEILKIKKGASTDEIKNALMSVKIKIEEKKKFKKKEKTESKETNQEKKQKTRKKDEKQI